MQENWCQSELCLICQSGPCKSLVDIGESHHRLELQLPDVVLMLEQTNKSSGTGNATVDLENVFFPFQLEKSLKNSLQLLVLPLICVMLRSHQSCRYNNKKVDNMKIREILLDPLEN